MISAQSQYEPWPALPYNEFKSTGYFLHHIVQIIGKLKLTTPFEPHWANVALWVTSRGLTTGPIPYRTETFTIDLDLINHQIIFSSSISQREILELSPMSVAQFAKLFFDTLNKMNIVIRINPLPQEIPNPIPFDADTEQRSYDKKLATHWWQILSSSYTVMQNHHAKFKGVTPPIGLMWGTFDLRDARYNGIAVPTTGPNSGYIRRNAMDEEQVEIGWWSGTDAYPHPAYYAFIYPQPPNIEKAIIKPTKARWETSLSEFILDYDDVRQSTHPARDLLAFFESTYQLAIDLSHWNPELSVSGKPL